MKKQVYVPTDTTQTSPKPTTVDDIPDIANRYVSLDTVLSWLDTLVEVHKNETNTRDN